MVCIYCKTEIYKDEPGWGFTELLGAFLEFHTECIEQFEEVLLPQ